jgi:hypothetical protein
LGAEGASSEPSAGGTSQPTAQLPAGLATEVLMAIGRKPVVRELHDVDAVAAARERWAALGCQTVTGEPVREDIATQAMVTEVDSAHTVRPLATHPLVERAVAVGGEVARRALLSPESRLHRWLCERLGAEEAPLVMARPPTGDARERQVVYASKDVALAERARVLDRMGADAPGEADAVELGELLGYPRCCAQAFADLERRWPNRVPIRAAMARTRTYLPRLNNLALHRFAWLAWFPCAYDCAASSVIADHAADHLGRTYPDLVVALDAELARPRLYLTDAVQAALVDARWDGPTRVRFAALAPLDQAAASALAAVASADHAVVDGGKAELRAGRQRLELPGDPLLLPFGLGARPTS